MAVEKFSQVAEEIAMEMLQNSQSKARELLMAESRSEVFAFFVEPAMWVFFVASLLFVLPAQAFIGNEDEQFQADINEAKARAHDFVKTIERIESAERDIEAAGAEIADVREREALEQERVRRQFVIERDQRPNEEAMREQLEREDFLNKEKEASEMEKNRREYVTKRDRVRKVITRDAYIDESREYGL